MYSYLHNPKLEENQRIQKQTNWSKPKKDKQNDGTGKTIPEQKNEVNIMTETKWIKPSFFFPFPFSFESCKKSFTNWTCGWLRMNCFQKRNKLGETFFRKPLELPWERTRSYFMFCKKLSIMIILLWATTLQRQGHTEALLRINDLNRLSEQNVI